uniref:Retrovirus-related Pol polyprotein from transposon TNT 1-94-like beta-barrel domain-containing protein n=1 Tax=Fagus sylvatica TaxID=28930 RepID=A0A2N9G2P8_FAGSY
MTHIVGLSTAHDVWLTLKRMFSSQSKARIMQIRYQLSTLKKGSLSVTEYFQKLKQLVDTLAAVHHPLDDFEVNSYLLAGLSSDYESMIASIQMLAAPMSLDELYGHLLTHEQRLTQLHPLPDVAAPSVNTVTTTPSNSNKGGRGNRSHNFSHGGRGNGGRSRGRGRGRGVLGPAPPTTSRPTCQVCHKILVVPTISPQTSPTSPFNAEEPTGYDQVYVGNGQGLPVHHTGSTHLLYPSSKFLMPNVLHVPSIQKNLLSVSQFTKDNNVSIDFHPSCFFVKDLTTGKVLLKGPLKHGLYSMPHLLPPPTTPVSFFGARASLPQWHYRLGHPAFRPTSCCSSQTSFILK